MKRSDFSKIFPKGSVLVFSLLILSILLVTSLTILSSSLLDRKASLSTGSSTRSFQVADSGVEEVLYQIYKVSPASLDALAGNLGVSCSSGVITFATASGTAKVVFYQDETTAFTDCASDTWRDKVVKIKSEGVAGSTTRAVEVAVAAAADGMAKAWVNFDGTSCPGGACSIRASYNVSSVERTAVGRYTIHFQTDLADSNFAAFATCSRENLNNYGCIASVDNETGSNAPDVDSGYVKIYTNSDFYGTRDHRMVSVSVYR